MTRTINDICLLTMRKSIFIGLFVVLAILIIILMTAGITNLKEAQEFKRKCSVTTTGTVEKVSYEHHRKGGEVTIVSYKFSVDGEEYTGSERIERLLFQYDPHLNEGDMVDVHYDPEMVWHNYYGDEYQKVNRAKKVIGWGSVGIVLYVISVVVIYFRNKKDPGYLEGWGN